MQRRLRAEAVVEQVQLNAMPDKEYKKGARALYKSITERRKIGNARRAAIAEGGESLVLDSFELVPMPTQPQPDAELYIAAASLLALGAS